VAPARPVGADEGAEELVAARVWSRKTRSGGRVLQTPPPNRLRKAEIWVLCASFLPPGGGGVRGNPNVLQSLAGRNGSREKRRKTAHRQYDGGWWLVSQPGL